MGTDNTDFAVLRYFQWNGPTLINTQLQLGGWRTQGGPNRFSGFPRLADRLASQHISAWTMEKPLKRLKAHPSPAATQLKLGVNEIPC